MTAFLSTIRRSYPHRIRGHNAKPENSIRDWKQGHVVKINATCLNTFWGKFHLSTILLPMIWLPEDNRMDPKRELFCGSNNLT
jgi:hypothetical protein